MGISTKLRGISSVIGAIIIDLVLGSVYTWSNINSYYSSYLKSNDSPNIEMVDGYFLMPIIIFISNLASYYGPKFDMKYGVKKCLALTILLVWIAHIMLLISTKLYVVYFAMTVFGIAIGMGYMSVMRNAWLYYPNKQGFISGVILYGYGVSALIFTWISDSIINPNYEKTNPLTGFFPKEIADRTYQFIIVLNVFLAILSVIGYVMIFDYYRDVDTEDKALLNLDLTKKNKETPDPIKQVFSKWQIWQIVIMNFSTLYFCFMCTNTNRSFGQLNQLSEELLSYLSKTFSFINGFGRIFWGFLFDKFGFKKLYLLLLISEIAVSSSLFYLGNSPVLYFFAISLTSFILSGSIALMIPLYPKIYGTKYASEINGIALALYGFSSLLGPIVSKFLIEDKSDYKLLYLSGTFFAIISLITCITFDEVPFKYETNNTDSDKELLVDKKELNK